MNYKKIYDELIIRAQNRTLVGYREKHHIIPRCMGGVDITSNIVELTPEEHFVAHELLIKIYPEVDKLIFAIIVMSGKKTCSNKLFGWHRRKLAETQVRLKTGVKRGPMSAEHKAAIGAANKGKIKTQEMKDRISAVIMARDDNTPWNKGTKGVMKASSGSFKTGNTPWNKGKEGVTTPWNKGLTKETDPRVAKNGKAISNTYKEIKFKNS